MNLEILLIAILTAVACALSGTFLVLRKLSMVSDAITHTILLGIVLAFFITNDLNHPLLLVGAAVMGVCTVWLTELLCKTKLVSKDASIGVVFPLLFSIAIVLISRYADSVHLDTDAVLLGELAFAPFARMVIFGVDIGAQGLYVSGGLVVVNLICIFLFYKELSLSTFDPLLCAVLGFSPTLLHYGLMTLVSLTAVGAFESVGSVLVIAFMIGPPATAYLLSKRLHILLLLSAFFGSLSGILGYLLAWIIDVSIPGSMAVMVGLLFLAVFAYTVNRDSHTRNV